MSERGTKIRCTIGGLTAGLALGGALFLASNDGTYRTTSPSSIQPVVPIETTIQQPITDYSKMTWQEAIKSVQTPVQAQHYLDHHFTQDQEEAYKAQNGRSIGIQGLFRIADSKGETFKHNHEKRKGVCIDYASAAAALLSDNNYPPLILSMHGSSIAHAVFLYKVGDKYGAVGNTPLKPVYNSVDELVRKGFADVYNLSYDRSTIVNLNDNYDNREEWVAGDIDLLKKFPK